MSRGVRHVSVLEDPLQNPAGFATAVAAICAARDVAVLIPVTDASVEAILEHRTLLPTTTVLPFAPRRVYRSASDKVLVHGIAEELGIGIRESCVVADSRTGAPDDPALYPGVVKPHRSVVGGTARRKTQVRLVADRAACDAVLRALTPEEFPVLVQRRVRGPGEGYFAARWGGRTVARFAHRRLREKPPSGGVSVYRESIAPDREVQDACDRLLDRLDWEGVAMIEGKRDLDSGRWCVMEINGRFWGSLQLAIDAGADFPTRLVNAATGVAVADPPAWQEGVRSRWEWGDLDHLAIRLLRSRQHLHLPLDAPSRFAVLLAVLRHSPRRDRLEVLRASDPAPFVLETLRRLGVGL